MDMLREEDGRRPFALSVRQIAELDRRASRCDHPLARLTTVATRVPIAAHVLAAAKVRGFDRRERTLAVRDPLGTPTRVALGDAALAALLDALAGRTSGVLLADAHGVPVAPDEDAVAYVDELITSDGEGPLPFAWSFRSLREGVFAGMADGGVPQFVAEAQAGLGRPSPGGLAETFMRVQERAASDWWSAQLGVPTPATVDAIRSGVRHLRWPDGPGDPSGREGRRP